jgi:hypothetical protein
MVRAQKSLTNFRGWTPIMQKFLSVIRETEMKGGHGMIKRAEDLLAIVLYELHEQGCNKFEASAASLHPVFYEWREKNRTSQLYKLLVFDTRDRFPFSETIQDALDALQFSGYLERTNPKGIYFEINPKIKKLYPAIQERFDENEIVLIRSLAQKIIENIKTVQEPRPVSS